mgnify:CR=1 FL=1
MSTPWGAYGAYGADGALWQKIGEKLKSTDWEKVGTALSTTAEAGVDAYTTVKTIQAGQQVQAVAPTTNVLPVVPTGPSTMELTFLGGAILAVGVVLALLLRGKKSDGGYSSDMGENRKKNPVVITAAMVTGIGTAVGAVVGLAKTAYDIRSGKRAERVGQTTEAAAQAAAAQSQSYQAGIAQAQYEIDSAQRRQVLLSLGLAALASGGAYMIWRSSK